MSLTQFWILVLILNYWFLQELLKFCKYQFGLWILNLDSGNEILKLNCTAANGKMVCIRKYKSISPLPSWSYTWYIVYNIIVDHYRTILRSSWTFLFYKTYYWSRSCGIYLFLLWSRIWSHTSGWCGVHWKWGRSPGMPLCDSSWLCPLWRCRSFVSITW